jgi:hypothetical protein
VSAKIFVQPTTARISVQPTTARISLEPPNAISRPRGSGTGHATVGRVSGSGSQLFSGSGSGQARIGSAAGFGTRGLLSDITWATGVYTTDGVRLSGAGAVAVLDDARCSTSVGRYAIPQTTGAGISLGAVTALDGAVNVTATLWLEWRGAATGYAFGRLDVNSWLTNQLTIAVHGDGGVVIQISDGSGNANVREAVSAAGTMAPGVPTKATMVFDGTQPGNAARLVLYVSTYSRALRLWSVDVALPLSFTGTIPAALITNPTLGTYIGNHNHGNGPCPGFYDDVRVWVGRSLTLAQVQAETLAVNVIQPSLWYNGADYTNHGSLAGFNGAPATTVALCSDDLRWGAPWQFAGTAAPTLTVNTAGAPVLRFDGVDDTSLHNAGLASLFQYVAGGFIAVAAATRAPATANGNLLNFSTGASTATRARMGRDFTAGRTTVFARRQDADSSLPTLGGTSDVALRDDLAVFDWANGTVATYQGGVHQTSSALASSGLTDNTPSAFVALGTDGNGAGPFHGDIAAVVVGNIVPTAAQIYALHAGMVTRGAAA